jgi:hypothetical protein
MRDIGIRYRTVEGSRPSQEGDAASSSLSVPDPSQSDLRPTFDDLEEWYESNDSDSLDSVGVAWKDKFYKIIKLDHPQKEQLYERRGVYYEQDFQKEVRYASQAANFGWAPEVLNYGVEKDEDTPPNAYAFIIFDRLDGSLESMLDGRQKYVEDREAEVFGMRSPLPQIEEPYPAHRSPQPSTPPTPGVATPGVATPSTFTPSSLAALKTPEVKSSIIQLKKRFESITNDMKVRGLVHLDMHEGNFFYKRGKRGNPDKWYLIDYGRVYSEDDPETSGNFPKYLKQIVPRSLKDIKYESIDHMVDRSASHLRLAIREHVEVDPITPLLELDKSVRRLRLDP